MLRSHTFGNGYKQLANQGNSPQTNKVRTSTKTLAIDYRPDFEEIAGAKGQSIMQKHNR